MNWDGNYAYSLAAFVVGGLAGFQAIYDRYKDESGSAVNTLPGYAYLFSRGIVPVIFFVLVYRTYQVRTYLLGLAIGLGLGTEAVLRSQFQVKSSRPARGALATENTFVGLFNLLDWYQKFFLELVRIRLTRKRQKIVRAAVRRIPRGVTFDKLCETVSINADALDEKDKKAVRDELRKQLVEYKSEVEHRGSSEGIESKFASKLGYWIYNSAGRWHGLNVLFKF
jgi:hypothetical protein